MPERVLLIGPRAAGKTSAGAALAGRLGLPFRDADAAVEEATGRTVAALLAAGEFRGHEVAVLAALLAGPPAVVAAGGGAVLWGGLREAAHGWRIVWLDAAPATLAARIRSDPRGRPSLTGRPADEEVEAVARERAPRYAAVAWRRVDTTALDVRAVVDRIEKLLRADPSAAPPNAD
jgi:shikimate kinase